MAGHTPGPWKHEEVMDRTGSPRAYSVWPCNQSGARNRICMTPDGTTPENKANAIIMASAPDLLAALKAALGPLELYHAYGWPDSDGVIRRLKAAISKAEGTDDA